MKSEQTTAISPSKRTAAHTNFVEVGKRHY